MPRRRDPNLITDYLCRFCGQRIAWGTILRLIRVDPDTPGFMLNESACHTLCLAKLLRPGVELAFHRHWNGRAPMLDDSADIYSSLSPGERGGKARDSALRHVRQGHRARSAGPPPRPEARRNGQAAAVRRADPAAAF